jgi:mannose-6-phosphate isomerase-like protein (cupin superfamily)
MWLDADAPRVIDRRRAPDRAGIEEVRHVGKTLAIILRRNFHADGVRFVTSQELSQQLAFMSHPAGKRIAPHLHRPVAREVLLTKEVLFLKSGRLRVDFYAEDRAYLESRVLEAGDVILLADGGHGFEALAPLEMIEVKQGPYAGAGDKVTFEGVSSSEIVLKGSVR